MNDEDAGWNWHDQRGAAWAAGAAAVALIVLLVWAVLRTATDSSSTPGVAPPATSVVTSATRKTVPSTTSYPAPSVQTSQGSASSPPPAEAPTADEPTANTPTSTTIYNPYVTTTTQNGGAV